MNAGGGARSLSWTRHPDQSDAHHVYHAGPASTQPAGGPTTEPDRLYVLGRPDTAALAVFCLRTGVHRDSLCDPLSPSARAGSAMNVRRACCTVLTHEHAWPCCTHGQASERHPQPCEEGVGMCIPSRPEKDTPCDPGL